MAGFVSRLVACLVAVVAVLQLVHLVLLNKLESTRLHELRRLQQQQQYQHLQKQQDQNVFVQETDPLLSDNANQSPHHSADNNGGGGGGGNTRFQGGGHQQHFQSSWSNWRSERSTGGGGGSGVLSPAEVPEQVSCFFTYFFVFQNAKEAKIPFSCSHAFLAYPRLCISILQCINWDLDTYYDYTIRDNRLHNKLQ